MRCAAELRQVKLKNTDRVVAGGITYREHVVATVVGIGDALIDPAVTDWIEPNRLRGGDLDRNGGFRSKVAITCLLYTSPSPRDQRGSRMPSSA